MSKTREERRQVRRRVRLFALSAAVFMLCLCAPYCITEYVLADRPVGIYREVQGK